MEKGRWSRRKRASQEASNVEEGERVPVAAGAAELATSTPLTLGQESLKDELEKHTPPKIIGDSTSGVEYADLVLYPKAELLIDNCVFKKAHMLSVLVDGNERIIGELYFVGTKYKGKVRVVVKLKRGDVWLLKDCDANGPELKDTSGTCIRKYFKSSPTTWISSDWSWTAKDEQNALECLKNKSWKLPTVPSYLAPPKISSSLAPSGIRSSGRITKKPDLLVACASPPKTATPAERTPGPLLQ